MTHSRLGTKIVCPNDGSTNVHWAVDHQKFHCDSCRHKFDQIRPVITEGTVLFNGIPVDEKISASLEVPDNIAEYKCTGCGAEVILDTTTSMGARCSWCRNELAMNKVIDTEFTPNGIIPFVVTKDHALEAFRKFVKKHWFVRKDFASKDADLEVKAIYYPFYALDRHWEFTVTGTGEHKSMSYRSGNYIYTDYTDYAISAQAKAFVDDFEKPALREIRDLLVVNNVQPYDWEKVRPFDYAYLNSFAAEHRDEDLTVAMGYINNEIMKMLHEDLNRRLQKALQLTKATVGKLEGVPKDEIAYCLAPMWLITYTDQKEKRVYYFAMNGQTGKVSGILPVSWQKLTTFLVIFTLVASLLAALLNLFFLVLASHGGNT